jgi:hypothetical protein
MKKSSVFAHSVIIGIGVAVLILLGLSTSGRAQDAAQSTLARKIGAIKSISGNTLTLTPDSGADVAVNVQPNARMLRIAPGAKDLKDAAPIQLQDLQVGDRVRVRGQAAGDAINALEIIAMARTDLEAHRQQEQQDWQKRGTGGLVSSVDPATGTVTITVTSFAGKKDIAVHTTKSTVFRRYAPDSVKFDDAKASTLAEIHPGDQLRARGDKNSDGSEVKADEIVSGSFRNVAGTVNSVDASAGTLSVQDLLSKKPITVKITAESQLHKLPPEMAQVIAMRLKGSMPLGMPGAGGGANSAGANGAVAAPPGSRPPGAMANGGGGQGAMNGGTRRGGGDFQQFLNRTPPVALTDLHKGDAVLIVATQGSAEGATAITLLSGVEPILRAAPSQAMMLTPWSLGGEPGADATQ